MAITNHERVGKALDLLKAGLAPFVEREIKSAIATNTITLQRVKSFVEDPILANIVVVVCVLDEFQKKVRLLRIQLAGE